MPTGDCPPSGRHDARASLSTARTPQCQGHSTERGQLQDVTRPTDLRAHDYAIPGTTQFLAPTSPAHHQFRYKTRPARPKWPNLARFSLAGRVFSRYRQQQAPHATGTGTKLAQREPRGETFTAPAPHTNPRNETFIAPARHKQPKITHFHHAGANFLSTTGVKTKPTNSRMQFHTAPHHHNLIIRRIPTIRHQTMKRP